MAVILVPGRSSGGSVRAVSISCGKHGTQVKRVIMGDASRPSSSRGGELAAPMKTLGSANSCFISGAGWSRQTGSSPSPCLTQPPAYRARVRMGP